MNKNEFIKEIAKLGINLTDEQITMFEQYCNYLLEYNSHTNLTAIKNVEGVYLKHFYDSATLIQCINFDSVKNVLDIGTGAGFPGLVLKILYPHLNVTLLDSNNKKIKFLNEIIKMLNLKDIVAIQARAEEFCQNKRESFDVVTARAVANLSILSELSIPFVKIKGYFLSLKGHSDEELDEAIFSINTLGGKIEKTFKFQLPYEESSRTIISIKKINKTPEKYPRRYEKIIKNPLKKQEK